MRARLPLLAATILLTCAACVASPPPSAPPVVQTAPSPSTPSPTADPATVDARILEVAITVDDLPPGWVLADLRHRLREPTTTPGSAGPCALDIAPVLIATGGSPWAVVATFADPASSQTLRVGYSAHADPLVALTAVEDELAGCEWATETMNDDEATSVVGLVAFDGTVPDAAVCRHVTTSSGGDVQSGDFCLLAKDDLVVTILSAAPADTASLPTTDMERLVRLQLDRIT